MHGKISDLDGIQLFAKTFPQALADIFCDPVGFRIFFFYIIIHIQFQCLPCGDTGYHIFDVIHHTIVGQRDDINLFSCSHLDHGDAFPDRSCCLHGNGHLLISKCRVNVESHISHLVIIDLNIHPLFQDLLQNFRHLEFAVKKHLDVVRQGIADLLMVPDTPHCKRNVVCKRKQDSLIYGIPESFLRFS